MRAGRYLVPVCTRSGVATCHPRHRNLLTMLDGHHAPYLTSAVLYSVLIYRVEIASD